MVVDHIRLDISAVRHDCLWRARADDARRRASRRRTSPWTAPPSRALCASPSAAPPLPGSLVGIMECATRCPHATLCSNCQGPRRRRQTEQSRCCRHCRRCGRSGSRCHSSSHLIAAALDSRQGWANVTRHMTAYDVPCASCVTSQYPDVTSHQQSQVSHQICRHDIVGSTSFRSPGRPLLSSGGGEGRYRRTTVYYAL